MVGRDCGGGTPPIGVQMFEEMLLATYQQDREREIDSLRRAADARTAVGGAEAPAETTMMRLRRLVTMRA